MAILISSSKNAFFFLIIVYVFSSTKLEIRGEQVLPGSKEVVGERERAEIKGEEWPKYVCTCE
jgi:hypothetical protein